MIASFRGSDTEGVFNGKRSRRLPPSIHRGAMRKLWMLDSAVALSDLLTPPGNRLEKLSGEHAGYHSIRINDQWRVRFKWKNGNANTVEIIDYH